MFCGWVIWRSSTPMFWMPVRLLVISLGSVVFFGFRIAKK